MTATTAESAAESACGDQDKAIAGLGEGRTDAAVAEALDGRPPEPALANIDAINAVFSAETVAEILARLDAHIEEEGAEADPKHWAVTARKLMVRSSAVAAPVAGVRVPLSRCAAIGSGEC